MPERMNAAAAPDLWEEIVNACTFYQVPAEVKAQNFILSMLVVGFLAILPEITVSALPGAMITLVVRKAFQWMKDKGNTEA